MIACMDHGAALAAVVSQILEHEVVLVRGRDRAMQGIVTSHDVAIQFMHFDPDGISPSDIDELRRIAWFVAQLKSAPAR